MPLPDTRHSLLVRLADPADTAAWLEFQELYGLAVYRVARGRGLQDAEAEDVVQEVGLAVYRAMATWRPSGRAGSFRAWLLETALRTTLRGLRNRDRLRAAGGTSLQLRLAEIPEAPAAASDDAQWRQWAFCWAAGHVEREVQPDTWQAFWLSAVEGLAAPEVARRLEVPIGKVYASKCRVISRIRARIADFDGSES
jgi:RNA polymerase sigma-70 factor (ECF subfamily)